jgi:hypothetical protein
VHTEVLSENLRGRCVLEDVSLDGKISSNKINLKGVL